MYCDKGLLAVCGEVLFCSWLQSLAKMLLTGFLTNAGKGLGHAVKLIIYVMDVANHSCSNVKACRGGIYLLHGLV